MSDNPVLETADKFYKTTDTSEQPKPTETPATEAELQDPPQEEEALEKPEEIKADAEIKSEELEATDDDEESHYVEIDGEEIDLKDVKKWRDGHMMQSDYTKKTTTLADDRKTFEAERDSDREQLLQAQSEVTELRDQLTSLTIEDEQIDWAELKEDDPDRYIELKEKADKRKELLAKVKAERETPADDPALIESERGKLFSANPDWVDKDGKVTEVYTKDITLMNAYAANAGYTVEDISTMTRSHDLNTLLKAAKYDQLQESGREIKKKREKVPVVTKPKASKHTEKSVAREDKFYAPVASG